jgi:hypothetical protein
VPSPLDVVVRRPGRLRDGAARPGAELLVARDDVDHQVPERPAESDHRDRRDRVQHQLLRRPRLHPGRARDHLGADDDRDPVLRERAQQRVGRAGDGDRQRAAVARCLQARDDVGRPPARREPDDRVRRGDTGRRDVGRTGLGVVLGRFLRLGERVRPAGDDRDDEPGRDAERRAALRRVDLSQPAGRAGAEIDEPATAFEPLDDRVDRGRELARGRPDGACHRRILRVDQLDELERGAEIEVGARGRALLGDRLRSHWATSLVPDQVKHNGLVLTTFAPAG